MVCVRSAAGVGARIVHRCIVCLVVRVLAVVRASFVFAAAAAPATTRMRPTSRCHAAAARLTRAPMHSMRPVTRLAILVSRAELRDLRRVCRLQLHRATDGCAALPTTLPRIEAASQCVDVMLTLPALPYGSSPRLLGGMRAAAQQLNESLRPHRPRALSQHLLGVGGVSLAHALLRDRLAALLGAPLPSSAVAIVPTQVGWIAADLPAAVLLAAVRTTCDGWATALRASRRTSMGRRFGAAFVAPRLQSVSRGARTWLHPSGSWRGLRMMTLSVPLSRQITLRMAKWALFRSCCGAGRWSLGGGWLSDRRALAARCLRTACLTCVCQGWVVRDGCAVAPGQLRGFWCGSMLRAFALWSPFAAAVEPAAPACALRERALEAGMPSAFLDFSCRRGGVGREAPRMLGC